jgi:amino acid transporter
MSDRSETSGIGYGFGTFKGVFTPSVLTILGVVMYLRMGWVLGNIGLPLTILVVTVASSITFITALSLSALATNMRVGGGGAYFVISRSLGVEAGAAIGIPLFLAQALGIAFYIAGFSESLVYVFPGLDPVMVGVVTLLVLTVVVYVSADLALKSQFIIMAAIALSLVSFAAGGNGSDGAVTEAPAALSFWPVFAVFFPAVTGIEAGIAMSGDLKDPARSLPRGTISAVVIGYAVYLAIPIALSTRGFSADTLRADPLVMQTSARWGGAVLVGIWAASLSSAMGALLGAPRTLQALARDRVLPSVVGHGFGSRNDPHVATVISFVIGLAGILLGNLNAIAPVLTMFFLTSYGVLNLSAGGQEIISNPSWRPRFRVWSWVSVLGFALCGVVMLMIAPGATMLATAVCSLIYYLMKRRSLKAQWGDMRLAFMMFLTRKLLYRMAGRTVDERAWKPNLLVLSGSPKARWYLIELANAISQSRSLVTVAAFIPDTNVPSERIAKMTEAIRAYLRKQRVHAFIRTLPASDPYEGATTMIRAYGFGPISPNTILIGETEQPSSFVRFAKLIQLIARSGRNLIIVRESGNDHDNGDGASDTKPRIDLWWSRMSSVTAFILALAILLRRSKTWANAELRLRTTVETAHEYEAALARLRTFLHEAHVAAEPEVLIRDGRQIFDVIRSASRDAELVFLAMRRPEPGEDAEAYSRHYEELLRETESLPATAFIMAAENLDFTRIFAESR